MLLGDKLASCIRGNLIVSIEHDEKDDLLESIFKAFNNTYSLESGEILHKLIFYVENDGSKLGNSLKSYERMNGMEVQRVTHGMYQYLKRPSRWEEMAKEPKIHCIPAGRLGFAIKNGRILLSQIGLIVINEVNTASDNTQIKTLIEAFRLKGTDNPANNPRIIGVTTLMGLTNEEKTAVTEATDMEWNENRTPGIILKIGDQRLILEDDEREKLDPYVCEQLKTESGRRFLENGELRIPIRIGTFEIIRKIWKFGMRGLPASVEELEATLDAAKLLNLEDVARMTEKLKNHWTSVFEKYSNQATIKFSFGGVLKTVDKNAVFNMKSLLRDLVLSLNSKTTTDGVYIFNGAVQFLDEMLLFLEKKDFVFPTTLGDLQMFRANAKRLRINELMIICDERIQQIEQALQNVNPIPSAPTFRRQLFTSTPIRPLTQAAEDPVDPRTAAPVTPIRPHIPESPDIVFITPPRRIPNRVFITPVELSPPPNPAVSPMSPEVLLIHNTPPLQSHPRARAGHVIQITPPSNRQSQPGSGLAAAPVAPPVVALASSPAHASTSGLMTARMISPIIPPIVAPIVAPVASPPTHGNIPVGDPRRNGAGGAAPHVRNTNNRRSLAPAGPVAAPVIVPNNIQNAAQVIATPPARNVPGAVNGMIHGAGGAAPQICNPRRRLPLDPAAPVARPNNTQNAAPVIVPPPARNIPVGDPRRNGAGGAAPQNRNSRTRVASGQAGNSNRVNGNHRPAARANQNTNRGGRRQAGGRTNNNISNSRGGRRIAPTVQAPPVVPAPAANLIAQNHPNPPRNLAAARHVFPAPPPLQDIIRGRVLHLVPIEWRVPMPFPDVPPTPDGVRRSERLKRKGKLVFIFPEKKARLGQ